MEPPVARSTRRRTTGRPGSASKSRSRPRRPTRAAAACGHLDDRCRPAAARGSSIATVGLKSVGWGSGSAPSGAACHFSYTSSQTNCGRQERPAERQEDVAGQPPAGLGAERPRRQPLQPAGVELAPPVHAVQLRRQPPVEPQQQVAAQVLVRAAQVRELHLPAGDRVADVGEGQEPGRRDAVEQLLDGLRQGRLLRQRRRPQPGVVEGVGQDRPEPLAQPLLGPVQGVLEQPDQGLPVGVGEPGRGQPAGGRCAGGPGRGRTAGCPAAGGSACARPTAPTRPGRACRSSARGPGTPAGGRNRIAASTGRVPWSALSRSAGSTLRQPLGLVVGQPDGGLEAVDQIVDVLGGGGVGRAGERRRGDPGGPGVEDGRRRPCPRPPRPAGAGAFEPVVEVVRLVRLVVGLRGRVRGAGQPGAAGRPPRRPGPRRAGRPRAAVGGRLGK